MLLSRVCGLQTEERQRATGSGAASLLHVTLQQQHDGRVALRRLFELLQRDLVVVVLIHFAEDLVHPLLWCQAVLVHLHHDHSAHHFVDSLRVRCSEKISRGLFPLT